MIDRMILWWNERSRREQLLLLVMLVLLLPVLVWLAILRPLDAAIEDARMRHWAAGERLMQVRSDAVAAATPARTPSEPAQLIVARAVELAGITPTRLDPGAEGRVMFSLATVKPAALRALLASLEQRGVIVETITIRANSDATVSADAVFRPRQG